MVGLPLPAAAPPNPPPPLMCEVASLWPFLGPLPAAKPPPAVAPELSCLLFCPLMCSAAPAPPVAAAEAGLPEEATMAAAPGALLCFRAAAAALAAALIKSALIAYGEGRKGEVQTEKNKSFSDLQNRTHSLPLICSNQGCQHISPPFRMKLSSQSLLAVGALLAQPFLAQGER